MACLYIHQTALRIDIPSRFHTSRKNPLLTIQSVLFSCLGIAHRLVPTNIKTKTTSSTGRTLRSKKVFCYQQNHQGQGPRLCPNQHRSSWRRRPCHPRWIRYLRFVRLRQSQRWSWWLFEQIGSTRRFVEERLELLPLSNFVFIMEIHRTCPVSHALHSAWCSSA